MPFVGIICKEDAMFIIDCIENCTNSPDSVRNENISCLLSVFVIPLMNIRANTNNNTIQIMAPNSSPKTENTKSACASGKCRFNTPSPGPTPNDPPFANASSDLVI